MPQVRLWTWWDGPQGPVPPGEVVRVSADEAEALASGYGELIEEDATVELAVVGPTEAAVAPRHRAGKRRRPRQAR